VLVGQELCWLRLPQWWLQLCMAARGMQIDQSVVEWLSSTVQALIWLLDGRDQHV
jgi:hypothetical protein